ncbi:hypothetical protein EI94DRAFT_1800386 [Lactarius quietus]|nr:hypothetical protein EI94DRAFT_1800386 [Lactarius quietus]
MILLYTYDEFTDKVDGDGVRVYAEMVMDAVHNLHNITSDRNRFWLRAIEITSPETQRRFIATFAEYVYAVLDEASDCAKGRVQGVEDYLKLMLLTTGPYYSFLPTDAGLTMPDEIMEHPALQSILGFAALQSILSSQSSGHGGHNIVTFIMNEKGVDLDGALNWLAEYHGQVLFNFHA